MKKIIFLVFLFFAALNVLGQDKDTDDIKAPPLPCTTPTTQANNFAASAAGSKSINLSWTRGDGDDVIILAHESAAVDADPVSGNSYTANSVFGSGSQIGTGNYVVYIGTATSTTVTGLKSNTSYYFSIYEFYSAENCYLTPANTSSTTTDAAPPTVYSVSPNSFYADKGKQLTISGSDLSGATVSLGGINGSIVSNDGATIVVNFPAAYYSNDSLTVSTGVSPDTSVIVSVKLRNIIPVGGGDDYHTSIQDALDGLYNWYGNTSFDAGQLPGAKVIEVYNGTYKEDVTPNANLTPTASDNLIIRNRKGQSPIIDASGLTNGFDIALNYVQIIGFTVHSADEANVNISGTNALISMTKSYGSVKSSGILLNGSTNSEVSNCLIYNNYNFGLRLISADNTVVKNNTIANNGHTSKAPPLPGVYDPAQIYVQSGSGISVQNNIFYSLSGSYVFTLKTESGITINSDYNTYFKNGNNYLVYYNGTVYSDLSAWSGNGAGTNDIENDPDFVNTGTDFHIKSENGSYAGGAWPPDIAAGGSWTNDASTSPALDAGNPSDSYSNEPQSGNRINQGAYGNTAQASKSVLTDITWNGNVSSDWQNANNWTPAEIPSSGNNVIIPDGRPNYPIIDDGTTTAECYNLSIDANSQLTIASNGQMTVYGSITNKRGVDGLIIESNSSGDGSLIQNTTGIDATVQRFLPTSGSPQWHFISPAISNASSSLFPGLYAYDESQDDWWTGGNYYYNSSSGWISPPATLQPATGYIYYHDQTTVALKGTLNAASSYSHSASYTKHNGNAPNGDSYSNFDGWTLIGNPYPCALDWEALDKSNDITPTVYYYDDNIHNYAYYQDGGSSLNGGSRFIPMMQGFFVKTNDDVDGGTIVIPANARTHKKQNFWKTNPDEKQQYIKLKVSDNNFSDETLIKLNNFAHKNYDFYLDAFKQFSWDSKVPQIYTLTADLHTSLAINNINLKKFRTSIPIGTKFYTSGTKIITVVKNTIKNAFVFIIDTSTDKIYKLYNADSLAINFPDSIQKGRLKLLIEKNLPPVMSNLKNIEEEENKAFVYSLPENFCTDQNTLDTITYSATLSDGNPLPSWLVFDPQKLTFSAKSPVNGIFNIKVSASDLFGATASSSFKLNVKKQKNSLDSNTFFVKIYPIPANNKISIETGGQKSEYSVQIISLLGQIIIQKNAYIGGINNINTQNLQAGTYFLKIILQNNTCFIKKIIVIK